MAAPLYVCAQHGRCLLGASPASCTFTRSTYGTADIAPQAITPIADISGGSGYAVSVQVRSFHFIVAMVAGWLQREQGAVIEYLKEENKGADPICQ